MTGVKTALARIRTLADLLERLGDVPLDRVRFHPFPGTATEEDVTAIQDLEGRSCELVDGVLVEKPVGLRESILAIALASLLRAFVVPRNLGLISGEAGTMKLFEGLVRIPDVAYASWSRFPSGRIPTEPIPWLTPDLAVEVLSKSNTEREMARKRREYFESGVCLVWLIDPEARTVRVYASPDGFVTLNESATLDGGDVLPGFVLPLRDLFSELDRSADG